MARLGPRMSTPSRSMRFTINTILFLEESGSAKRGKAARSSARRIAPRKLAVNTNGGGLSIVTRVVRAVLLMRRYANARECGARQVKDCEVAVGAPMRRSVLPGDRDSRHTGYAVGLTEKLTMRSQSAVRSRGHQRRQSGAKSRSPVCFCRSVSLRPSSISAPPSAGVISMTARSVDALDARTR